MLIVFLSIGIRMLGILNKHGEMSNVRYLWQPVIIGGFFFLSCGAEDIVADIYGLSELALDLVFSLTVIAGATAFIIALSRLYKMWSDYDRQRTQTSHLDKIVDRVREGS